MKARREGNRDKDRESRGSTNMIGHLTTVTVTVTIQCIYHVILFLKSSVSSLFYGNIKTQVKKNLIIVTKPHIA